MSIPISQKVDLLYKQAFGVTKTDTEANKSPSNESIESPLLIRGDTLWSQADQIPAVAAASAGLIQEYTGTGAQECTADNTTVPIGGVYPTWKTDLTYWIPAEFGSTYSVSVWVDDASAADPTSTGTQIFNAGAGGTGEFYYNYQSGVLNFIGETIPTALTSSKVLYIVGYRYIGLTGVTNLPDGTLLGNLSITDQTVTGQDTNANIIFTPDGTGQVVTGGNITASYFYGNGSQLSGIDATSIQNGTSNVSIPAADGNIQLNVDGGLIANITDTGIVATLGNLDIGNVIGTGIGSFTGNVSGGNLTSAGVVEVTGNVIGGNITTVGVVAATGNVSGGNLTTVGAADITGNLTAGNVDGGNLVNANFFTGTLIDGTSNITITNNGNVTLVAEGNAAMTVTDTGAYIVGTVNANGIATLGSVVTSQVTGAASGNLTLSAGSTNQYIELRPTGTGHVDVGGHKIESLGTPVSSTDAATKQYVDDVAQGLHVHAPAIVASTDTLATMSGGTVTYNNGTAGVGATLTISGSTLTAIDGVTLTINDRIIVKDEVTEANNGIYVYTSTTVLTRSDDYDTPTEMAGGDFTFVQQGTLYEDTGWVQTNPVTTVGTSDVTWVQFSGSGSFTAGAGLTLTGTEFSVNTDGITTEISGGNVVVKTSAQFTTPNIGEATGTSLTATGNVAGGNVTTTGVVAATGNVIGGNVYANAGIIGATTLTGSLSTAAQPNVTSVGTLTSLTVTGNTTSGNLNTGGVVAATGNVAGGNLTSAGVVEVTGNVIGGNLTTAGLVSATGNIDTTAGIFNGDGFGISNIAAGNIVGLNLSGISNGTSNVDIATADGNITMSVDSVSNVAVVTATGLEVTGTAGISGTVTASAFTANTGIFTGDGGGLSNVVGANVTGQVGNALVAGTVYTPAQPAITSVGTLTDLTVTGNTTSGNLNTGGVVAATGNVAGGNLTTVGVVDATGNVSGGNVTTTGVVAATGNVSGGNITTAGIVDAGTVEFDNLSGTGAVNVTDILDDDTMATASNTTLATSESIKQYVDDTVTASDLDFQGDSGSGAVDLDSQTLDIAGGLNITTTALNQELSIAMDTTLTGMTAATFTANVDTANLNATGVVDATGNVSGGNLTSAGVVEVTGNVIGGNITTVGVVDATGNVSGANLTTTGVVAATGNVSGGNITTAGIVDAGTVEFDNLSGTGAVNVTDILDDDTMATASNTTLATSESIKQYVDDTVTASDLDFQGDSGSGAVDLDSQTLDIAGGLNITTTALNQELSVVMDTTLTGMTAATFTANVDTANLNATGVVAATGNVSGGNITTVGVVDATGNVSGANLTSAGVVEVTGNVIGGNITTVGVVDATGNVSGGNVTTTGVVAATGNVSGGNITTTGTVTGGTITDGTLSSTAGTITGGVAATFSGNVTAGNVDTTGTVVTDLVTGKTSGITITAVGTDQPISLQPTGTGSVDVNSARITELATPTAPTDAATKQYVDDVAQGLHVHEPSVAASTDTLATMSGGTVAYNNGTAGVGATLTISGSTLTAIDSVTLTAADRIVIKNETTAAYNGIYVYTSSTVLTRADDFDTPTEMSGGDFTFVQQGTLYHDTGWVMTDAVTTVGTSDVNWVQFSGSGSFTAGAGLTLTGTEFSVNVDNVTTAITAGNVVVKTSAQLTTPNIGAATGTSLSATGNVSGGNITTVGIVDAGTVEFDNLSGTGAVNVTDILNDATLSANSATALATQQSIKTYVDSVATGADLDFQGDSGSGAVDLDSQTFDIAGGLNITTTALNQELSVVMDTTLTGMTAATFTANVDTANLNATANVTSVGVIASGDANVAGEVNIGASEISTIAADTITTTGVGAAIITQFPVSGINGCEFIVKSIDTPGTKYGVATILAVTDGSTVDYTIYGQAFLGSTTGTLSVGISGANIALSTTPASSNSTVWTTQYRAI